MRKLATIRKIDSLKVFVFDIWDIDTQSYLSPLDRGNLFDELVSLGFTGNHVPILDADFVFTSSNVNELLKLADGESYNSKIREGNVYKSHDGQFSFKIINNKFLLKFDE